MTLSEVLRGFTLKPCAYCNSAYLAAITVSGWFHIECSNCWAKGPKAITLDAAVKRWNARWQVNRVTNKDAIDLLDVFGLAIERLEQRADDPTKAERIQNKIDAYKKLINSFEKE